MTSRDTMEETIQTHDDKTHIEIEDLLSKTFPVVAIDEIQPTKEENTPRNDSLYLLLDELSGTRKLMSNMFGATKDVNLSSRDNLLRSKVISIGEEWYQGEHPSSDITAKTRSLQGDTPVYFSWSQDNSSTSRPSSPLKKPLKSATVQQESATGTTKKYVSNSELLKVACSRITEITNFPNSWDDIINDKSSTQLESSNTEEKNESTKRQESDQNIAHSTFKVNPLATFVAQELPKERKLDKKNDKKSHHSKSKLWFWGGGKSKKKHSKKNKEGDESPSGNLSSISLRGSQISVGDQHSQSKSTHTSGNLVNDILGDDPVMSDSGTPNVNFLEPPTSNMLELKLTNTFDDQSDSISNINSREMQYPAIDTKKSTSPPVSSDSEPSNDDDSDDEFGDFEQAIDVDSTPLSISKPPATINTSVLTSDLFNTLIPPTPATEQAPQVKNPSVTMSSFVPLQPSKK